MSRRYSLQVFFVLILCMLVAIFPWWAVAIIILVPFLLFETFYGAIIVGLLMDSYYGQLPGWAFPFPFLAGSIVLVALFPVMKRRLVFWNRPKF